MESQELVFELSADDEEVVRTYKCTTLKRWFVPPTIGYLTVTNKRLVFHSSGKSLTGKSLMISEMPLDDVAGLGTYEGLSINWFSLLLFSLFAFFISQIIFAALPSFLTSYWMVALLIIPYAFLWLLNSNILNDQLKESIQEPLENLLPDRFKDDQNLGTYLHYARIPLYLGLAILGWRLAFTTNFGLGTPIIAGIISFAFYVYIFMDFFGRRNSFSLEIGSKSMKEAGIFIPGDSLQILPGRNTTALQGLGGSPAEDSSQVIRELGALLMDIQQLGDLGIEKWKS